MQKANEKPVFTKRGNPVNLFENSWRNTQRLESWFS